MATKLANQEEEGQGSTKMKKNLDNWKYPKIPVDQVYKKKRFEMFRKYAIKDHEETITRKSSTKNISVQLTSRDFIKGFIKKHHQFLHLGLVQIGIKPLIRDGLGAPIIVCLRDARHLNFKNSLLAVVECDLSQGPFYFNCFPSFSVSLNDDASLKALNLKVKTGGIPLVLTYRLVCTATVDLNIEVSQEPTLGETAYFQARSGASSTTKWDEVQVPEEWTHEGEPQKRSMATEFVNEEEEDLPKTKKNQDNWKYPKIPVDAIYEKKKFRFFRSYAIKDYEKTITLESSNQNVSVQLLSKDFLKCFIRRYHNYLHLGLVQISVQPLLRHGLGGGSIVVCLRDGRFLKFNSGLLAVVESDLSQAPFYFNCFPSFPVCLSDDISPVLTLHVKTSGIPLALTYRVVCMATKDITIGGWGKLKLGETTYFQTSSGNSSTTKWDEVQVLKDCNR